MPTWIEAYNASRAAFAKTNGVTPASIPRVTNEQAASVLRYSMSAAKKLALPPDITERWYEVALALAGWRQPGDKFLVTEAHRRAMFPDAATPVLWQLALNVAQTAQNRGLPFAAPTVNPETDYREVLKQAWSKMQRDAKGTGQPAPAPALPAPPPAETRADSGDALPLLLLAALALGRKGRR